MKRIGERIAKAGAVFFCAASVVCATGLTIPAPAKAVPYDSGAAPQVSLNMLSPSDAALYRRIAAAQDRGDWAGADALIAQLSDRILMGYVLKQRYLSRTYVSSVSELTNWMNAYADLPGADRIYDLALRKGASANALTQPQPRQQRPVLSEYYAVGHRPSHGFSAAFNAADAHVRRLVSKDYLSAAIDYVDSTRIRSRLTQAERDKVKERIVGGLFLYGDDERALAIASDVGNRNAAYAPLVDWYGGLSAWRQGYYPRAANHFSRLARQPDITAWTRAAGGYWAARSYIAAGEPQRAAEMLEVAANTGATFYGLIASRQLGRDIRFTWITPTLDRAGVQLALADPGVARAVALNQIPAYRDAAEEEMVWAAGRSNRGIEQALIAIAEELDMPGVQLKIAAGTYVPPSSTTGGALVMNAGLFPVPDYMPYEGYRLDRALLLAIARQESLFRVTAVSHAGARGLMQIMPGTARHIQNTSTVPRAAISDLSDPVMSLTYGQQYLTELMNYGEPYGNLFMMTTAYNGGPGNLARWRDEVDYRNDPLFYIESIPAAETRGYIERVMTNMWIYRDRLGQPAPSLDAVAAGQWPVYQAMERSTPRYAGQIGGSSLTASNTQ